MPDRHAHAAAAAAGFAGYSHFRRIARAPLVQRGDDMPRAASRRRFGGLPGISRGRPVPLREFDDDADERPRRRQRPAISPILSRRAAS